MSIQLRGQEICMSSIQLRLKEICMSWARFSVSNTNSRSTGAAEYAKYIPHPDWLQGQSTRTWRRTKTKMSKDGKPSPN